MADLCIEHGHKTSDKDDFEQACHVSLLPELSPARQSRVCEITVKISDIKISLYTLISELRMTPQYY